MRATQPNDMIAGLLLAAKREGMTNRSDRRKRKGNEETQAEEQMKPLRGEARANADQGAEQH